MKGAVLILLNYQIIKIKLNEYIYIHIVFSLYIVTWSFNVHFEIYQVQCEHIRLLPFDDIILYTFLQTIV